MNTFKRLLIVGGLFSMVACKTTTANDGVNAVLDAPSAQVLEQVKKAAAQLVGQETISLSATAFIDRSWINLDRVSALSNDPSIERAIKLQLVKSGNDCYLRHEVTGKAVPLPGVSCKAE